MINYFTVVFEGDVTRFQKNPMKFKTVFGPVEAISMGDVCKEFDALAARYDDALKRINDMQAELEHLRAELARKA